MASPLFLAGCESTSDIPVTESTSSPPTDVISLLFTDEELDAGILGKSETTQQTLAGRLRGAYEQGGLSLAYAEAAFVMLEQTPSDYHIFDDGSHETVLLNVANLAAILDIVSDADPAYCFDLLMGNRESDIGPERLANTFPLHVLEHNFRTAKHNYLESQTPSPRTVLEIDADALLIRYTEFVEQTLQADPVGMSLMMDMSLVNTPDEKRRVCSYQALIFERLENEPLEHRPHIARLLLAPKYAAR